MKTRRATISISGYHKEILRDIRYNVKRVVLHCNVEDIHRLRLDIKRIKAIYELLHSISPSKFNARTKAAYLKNIFSNTGAIRDMQVNKQRVRALKLPINIYKPYIRYMNNEISSKRGLLKIDFDSFDWHCFTYNELSINALSKSLTKKELQKAGLHFIGKRFKKIKKLNRKNAGNSDLHKIRKHIKEISAIAALLHKITPTGISKEFRQEIKVIGETMGVWHDNCLLILSMESFSKDYVKGNNKESAPMENSIGKMRKENKKLAAEFRHGIRQALKVKFIDK